MTARARLACAGAAALLASCSGSFPAQFPFSDAQPRPGTEQGAWARTRDRFTATGKLYDGLATRAFASAVYQAPEVREARIARVAVWRELPVPERERLAAAEAADAERFDDFLLSFFTTDRPDNDLDTGRSVWRVALVVAGEGESEAIHVEQVRADATLRTLYPNVGDFDVVYRVRFDRWGLGPLSQRKFTLRLAGARGRLDLPFALPAPPQQPPAR